MYALREWLSRGERSAFSNNLLLHPFAWFFFFSPPLFFLSIVLVARDPKGWESVVGVARSFDFIVAEYRSRSVFLPLPRHVHSLSLLAQVSPIYPPSAAVLVHRDTIEKYTVLSLLHSQTTPTHKDHGRRFTLSRCFSLFLSLPLSESNDPSLSLCMCMCVFCPRSSSHREYVFSIRRACVSPLSRHP